MSAPNRLYFGDCLDVMQEDITDESVDLIYLDPPFNSKRLYNAFIGNAQWVAFNDTWRWHEAENDFHEVVKKPGPLSDTLEGLRKIHGEGATLAYLSYIANRLKECWRVLKPSGSVYFHCDPTMSHSIKLLMDGLAGKQRFRNEIIWHYQKWSNAARCFQRNHDVLLFYGKSSASWFCKLYGNPTERQIYLRKIGFNTGSSGGKQIVRIYDRQSPTVQQKIASGEWEGRHLYDVKAPLGSPLSDVWNLSAINGRAKERVGYPTQKPLTLLNRIIQASSRENDIVMDPFCGCGTTIEAAQRLGRNWIGIDICVNACKVIEKRMKSSFDSIWSEVEFIGLPKTQNHAKTLASMDKFRFERWAAGLVDGMEYNKVQRGDKGIDGKGRIAIRKGQFIDLVSQVKGGGTSPGDVQAFNGARQQARADLGIFTCFQDRVTFRMKEAAASTGRFMEVPKVQIYTVEDFFEGRKPLLPLAS